MSLTGVCMCVCVHVWKGGYIRVRTCINVIVDLIIRPHKLATLASSPKPFPLTSQTAWPGNEARAGLTH